MKLRQEQQRRPWLVQQTGNSTKVWGSLHRAPMIVICPNGATWQKDLNDMRLGV